MIKLLDMTARGEKGVGVTLRELLSKQELKFLLEGGGGTKGDPLVLFNKYFGVDVAKHLPLEGDPKTINAFTKKLMRMKDRGGNWFDEASFNPEEPVFAEGGLANILQVPRKGYGDGLTVGSDRFNLNVKPKFFVDVNKIAEGDFDVKNKAFGYGADIKANYGPLVAGANWDKIKHKIKVGEKDQTVFKDAQDFEKLLFEMGYSKDGLEALLSTNKDLNNLQLSLKKTLTKEPKRIFAKQAEGGLAGILRI
jgi:hypothetical protein